MVPQCALWKMVLPSRRTRAQMSQHRSCHRRGRSGRAPPQARGHPPGRRCRQAGHPRGRQCRRARHPTH
eukprot:9488974-Pyramimonas_sp.AAC.1